MEYKKFEKMVELLKAHEQKVNSAYDLKIDLIDFTDDLQSVVSILLEEAYGKEGLDWFDWFRFESDYGDKKWKNVPVYEKGPDGKLVEVKGKKASKYGAHDEKGNPICYSVKSTWEFLEENYGKNKKDAKKKGKNVRC
jgi:hypothetical protein